MKNTIIADLFQQTNQDYVEYEGKMVFRVDRVNVPKKGKIKIIWEKYNNSREQIIQLYDHKGLSIDGETSKLFNIWHVKNKNEVVLDYYSKSGTVIVNNAWEYDGEVNSMIGSAGMIFEDIPNGRRYRCNDVYPDVDFEDLVFSLYWENP